MGQVHWNHVPGQFGSEIHDYWTYIGWPRQCAYTTGDFYIADPEPPEGESGTLLDEQGFGCGCLERCA